MEGGGDLPGGMDGVWWANTMPKVYNTGGYMFYLRGEEVHVKGRMIRVCAIRGVSLCSVCGDHETNVEVVVDRWMALHHTHSALIPFHPSNQPTTHDPRLAASHRNRNFSWEH